MGSPDRFLHFIAGSAVFHVVAAPLTYWLWHRYIRTREWDDSALISIPLWISLLLYLAVPFVVGSISGSIRTGGRVGIGAVFRGSMEPPRAWDYFFSARPDGWVRLRLKSGTWVGGAYAAGSFAAGYPEPADLYLSALADIDADSGDFLFDSAGKVVLREGSMLIRWDEIEYLEFIDG